MVVVVVSSTTATIPKNFNVYCGNGKWRERRRLTDCKEMNGGRPNIWNHTGSYVEEGIFQSTPDVEEIQTKSG
jgi:hypothetical protein